MKWIVIAIIALTTPVLAMTLSDGHCAEIEVELKRAVKEGTITRREAKRFARRCNKTKDWRHDSSKVHQTNEESRTGYFT